MFPTFSHHPIQYLTTLIVILLPIVWAGFPEMM